MPRRSPASTTRCSRNPGAHPSTAISSAGSTTPTIRDVLFTSALARLAATLLGGDAVVLVEDQWFASAPGADTASPWHQDEPYYNIDGAFVTLWLALDDAPAGAALSVVAGSHRWGRTFAPVAFVAGQPDAAIDDSGRSRAPDARRHRAGRDAELGRQRRRRDRAASADAAQRRIAAGAGALVPPAVDPLGRADRPLRRPRRAGRRLLASPPPRAAHRRPVGVRHVPAHRSRSRAAPSG